MPIHDQTYRRYGGRRDRGRGSAWLVIARNGILTIVRKQRCSWACCSPPGSRSSSARSSIYFSTQLPAGLAASHDRRSASATFLECSRTSRLHHHGVGGRGPHRQRQARQRPADLPVEAAHAHRVHHRQAGDPRRVPARRDAGAGAPAARAAGGLQRAASRSCGRTSTCSRRSPLFAFLQVLLAAFTMLALSSISKSSRYVAILYAGVFFFSRRGLRRSSTRSPAAAACRGCRCPRTCARSATSSSGCSRATRRPRRSRCSPMIVVIGLSAWVLERQVRGVEVVS